MRQWLFAASTLLLAGCGQTVVHRVELGAPRAPTTSVEVHLESVPDRPYVDAGLVQAFGYGTDAKPAVVEHAIVAEARKMGCDAVVKVRVDQVGPDVHAIGVCAVFSR